MSISKFTQPQAVPEAVDLTPPDLTPQTITASDGTVITQMPDGSSIIGGGLAGMPRESSFDENLAHLDIDVSDILEGIEVDIRSRQEMVEAYIKGIDLLGLKIKDRSGSQQRKNVSTINHPILLESIVKFQSAARAEMLPAAGPCKVMVAGEETEQLNDLAQKLQDDLNYYLTTVATEYYPDTDRGLFRLGFGGTIFKKVYNCPIRKRPVSECVYLPDLIVSEEATDLQNAIRVTHQIMMSPNDVKRMMASGAWEKGDLTMPSMPVDPVAKKVASVEGVNKTAIRPKDMQHTIYECYCDLDLGNEKDAPEGMPLPYRVTIDKDSRRAVDVRRNWKEGDTDYKKKLPFVMFGLIPGMGFLNYGYLHLLGNQTKALTAIWRLLIDAGMFSNFPGGVRVKGTRQTTNEINPGPGEWPEIDTGPMDDIRKSLMPLPYKEPSAVLIQLSEIIGQDATRMAGSAEMQVGEGRTNVPVGTMMAMIEQQTQVMAAVHKRLHSAQAQELMKLKELFAENPESLTKFNPQPGKQWTVEEFNNLALIPASDPNIPAQVHRIMQSTALGTLATSYPQHLKVIEIIKRILKNIGISDPDSLINADQQTTPDPKILAHLSDAQAKQAEIAQEGQKQQREAAEGVIEAHLKIQDSQIESQQREADRQSREKVAMIHLQEERLREQTAREQAEKSHELEAHKILLGHKKLQQEPQNVS